MAAPPPASLAIYPLPSTSVQPYDLTVGPDGNLWSPYNFASTLARITPTGTPTEFPLGFLIFPRITAGADGNLWMLDLAQNTIDKITTSGVVAGQFHFSGGGGVGDVTKGSIVGNIVKGNGATNAIGNGIGISVGFSWDLGPTEMLVKGNQVQGNGVDGIRIGNPFGIATGNPTGNKILDNNAINNATNPGVDGYEGGIQAFDLHDLNVNCDHDVWRGNTWGSAGYSPACTAIGGSGPAPAVAKDSLSATPNATAPTGPHAKEWEEFLNNGRR
ncbi:MAG: hypothetical protein ACR2LJ_05490 [Acidimicrobiales bacterium]